MLSTVEEIYTYILKHSKLSTDGLRKKTGLQGDSNRLYFITMYLGMIYSS